MHGPGAAADGLRQRLPRAARAGAHRRRRAPAERGAHRDSLDAPRVRARPGGRRGLGCPQSIQNCSVTAAGGAYRDPSPPAVLARRGQCGARPAVGARRRSQCRRRASARLARRVKLFFFPRLAPVPVNTQVLSQSFTQKLRACYALTKPRVVSLIVFTAVIGMFLATPGAVSIQILLAWTAGIALVAAALLVARAVPHRGLCAGRRAHASGDPRQALHAPPGPALHADPLRRDPAALRGADERLALSRCRHRAGRDVRRLRAAHLFRVQRPRRAENFPVFDCLPCRVVCRASRRSLSVALRCSPPATAPARSSRAPTSPASSTAGRSRSPTRPARRVTSKTSAA